MESSSAIPYGFPSRYHLRPLREREHEKLFQFLLDIVLPLWHLYELHDGQCGRCLPSMRAVYIEQLLQAYGASQ